MISSKENSAQEGRKTGAGQVLDRITGLTGFYRKLLSASILRWFDKLTIMSPLNDPVDATILFRLFRSGFKTRE
jgi:hypothetical protein